MKIKNMMMQVENYVRQINKLKDDVKSRNITIKEIKELYWQK